MFWVICYPVGLSIDHQWKVIYFVDLFYVDSNFLKRYRFSNIWSAPTYVQPLALSLFFTRIVCLLQLIELYLHTVSSPPKDVADTDIRDLSCCGYIQWDWKICSDKFSLYGTIQSNFTSLNILCSGSSFFPHLNLTFNLLIVSIVYLFQNFL